jgi:hypothetical protein
VKSLLRILFVWLVLLAVPLQGFAAAAAFGCAHGAPAHGMQAHETMRQPAMQHGHACHQHHAAKADAHDGKCGNCAACCAGAAIAPPVMSVAGLATESSHYLIADAGPVPSADPDHPERPPRLARA